MNEERKLKRGLKDISPLFDSCRQTAPPPVSEETGRVQSLSVFSPDYPGDSLFLNTFLASQIASPRHPCTILTIDANDSRSSNGLNKTASFHCESLANYLKRFHLTWDEFHLIGKRSLRCRLSREPLNQILFLDVDYGEAAYFQRVVPVLDKWVILLQPTVESLMDAYRMIKGTRVLNYHLEYYLIFEGQSRDGAGSFAFEEFSSLLARRFGIHLVWLGYLHLPGNSEGFSSELAVEHLFWKDAEIYDIPEKIALAELALSAKGQTAKVAS